MENVKIAEAGLEDLDDVAFMFDQYRQFYDQDEDLKLAKEFLGSHMKNNTSIIFLASFDGRNCGFAQLYPTFCKTIWVSHQRINWQTNRRLFFDRVRFCSSHDRHPSLDCLILYGLIFVATLSRCHFLQNYRT